MLPDIGMKSVEITFGAWLKPPGSKVKIGEELFEVEADKATIVFEAEANGILEDVCVIGSQVKEGDILGYIRTDENESNSDSP